MKKFYSISRNRNASPAFLIFTILIALYIMTFVNGFMGSLGGIPAATGAFCVIYLLKGMVNEGNCISHQLAMTSRREVLYLFLNYAVGYGLIWAVMRVLQVVARITGWGTIEGMSVYTYFHNLYGTSMLERWAYISTFLLMYSFVLALFPIVVIKKKRIIVLYISVVSLIYLLITYGIRLICRGFIRKTLRNRAKCVLDSLLLSQFDEKWQTALVIIGVVILVIGASILAIHIAICYHGPKPGSIKVDESKFPVVDGDHEDFLRALAVLNRKRKIMRIISGCVGLGIIGAVSLYLFTPVSHPKGYTKVAECLTDDTVLGPMVYGNDVYIPVNMEVNYHEEGIALGYLGHKGENCDSRFYKLAIANFLYKVSGETMLELYGNDNGCYQMEAIVAGDESWKKDNVFLLWDEEWQSESASHKGNSGYSVLSKQFIIDLKEAFPEARINEKDFSDYDAFFTIMGYENANMPLNDNIILHDWCGYILVKNNQFYYNNYNNLIEGQLLEELKAVVGGNTNGGNPMTESTETEEIEGSEN